MSYNVTLDYEIFTEYVWNGPLTKWTIIEALTLDIDAQQWHKSIEFMINLKFDQNYSKVFAWPLIQKERQLQPFVDSTIQSHNNYMDTTRK